MELKYDCRYVEELQGIAEEMRYSIENMLSIVSPKIEPVCGNLGATNQAELILDQYHKLMRDWSSDERF